MKATFYNDFHNTEVTVIVPPNGVLTARQTKRVRKELCGMSDCCCGGIRGSQKFEHDWTYGQNSHSDLLVVGARIGEQQND